MEIEGEGCCVRLHQVECVAEMRKVLLCQWRWFWIKELENLAQCSKFAAVTQIECMDHAAMLGCISGVGCGQPELLDIRK